MTVRAEETMDGLALRVEERVTLSRELAVSVLLRFSVMLRFSASPLLNILLSS